MNFENWTNGEPHQLPNIRVFKVDYFILPLFLEPKLRSVAQNVKKTPTYFCLLLVQKLPTFFKIESKLNKPVSFDKFVVHCSAMVIPESRVHSDLSYLHKYTQSGRVLLDSLHVRSVDIFSSQRKDRALKQMRKGKVKTQIPLNKVQLGFKIVCKSNKILWISKLPSFYSY